jgi:hypothetical protein
VCGRRLMNLSVSHPSTWAGSPFGEARLSGPRGVHVAAMRAIGFGHRVRREFFEGFVFYLNACGIFQPCCRACKDYLSHSPTPVSATNILSFPWRWLGVHMWRLRTALTCPKSVERILTFPNYSKASKRAPSTHTACGAFGIISRSRLRARATSKPDLC